MSNSQTKKAILQRHVANELLLAPSVPSVPRSPTDLSADHPTMKPDLAIVDHVTEALQAGMTHYVDVPGMPPLREALAKHLQGTGLSSIEAANVLVTAGMQETRFLSIQILGNLLGPVAIPEVVHPGVRKALGIRPIQATSPLPCDRASGFLPTLDGIQTALENGAKVLFLESPVRLTGAAYDADAVARIAELAVQHEAAVIWDQGLAPWVADYVSIWRQPGMEQRAVLIGEAFPGIGLESWYIGYVATNTEWWENIRRDKQAISICTSTPAQLGAIKGAEVYANLHAAQFEALASFHGQAVAKLDDKALPGDAVCVVAVAPSDIMAAPNLRKQGLDPADGTDFGAHGVLRLAVTPDHHIAQAIDLLS